MKGDKEIKDRGDLMKVPENEETKKGRGICNDCISCQTICLGNC